MGQLSLLTEQIYSSSNPFQPPTGSLRSWPPRRSGTTTKMTKRYQPRLPSYSKSNHSFLSVEKEKLLYEHKRCLVWSYQPHSSVSWAQQHVQTYNRYIHIDLLRSEPPNWLNLCHVSFPTSPSVSRRAEICIQTHRCGGGSPQEMFLDMHRARLGELLNAAFLWELLNWKRSAWAVWTGRTLRQPSGSLGANHSQRPKRSFQASAVDTCVFCFVFFWLHPFPMCSSKWSFFFFNRLFWTNRRIFS